ncbi:hypothetical protein LXJ59_24965, partial [Escherichia coli]|nr:hypothetical protein [Escherichia coli]
QEAFATYARVLAPRGLLLVHVSNRFLDLEPVVAAAAHTGGWHAAEFSYRPPTYEPEASPSQWIALSRDPEAIRTLTGVTPGWRGLAARPG